MLLDELEHLLLQLLDQLLLQRLLLLRRLDLLQQSVVLRLRLRRLLLLLLELLLQLVVARPRRRRAVLGLRTLCTAQSRVSIVGEFWHSFNQEKIFLLKSTHQLKHGHHAHDEVQVGASEFYTENCSIQYVVFELE